jgi:hypothetical protein
MDDPLHNSVFWFALFILCQAKGWESKLLCSSLYFLASGIFLSYAVKYWGN